MGNYCPYRIEVWNALTKEWYSEGICISIEGGLEHLEKKITSHGFLTAGRVIKSSTGKSVAGCGSTAEEV